MPMTAHNTAKINFVNSGAVGIIGTAYYIHGRELMKLIFAVLCVMSLTRCYKTQGFFNIYWSLSGDKVPCHFMYDIRIIDYMSLSQNMKANPQCDKTN